MKPILAALFFIFNETRIIWLRAELTHALNSVVPHSMARVRKLCDAMNAARGRRPAWMRSQGQNGRRI